MDIKTKFNLKDSVWFMKDNKPVNALISAIETFNVGTDQDKIKYNGRKISNSVSWLDYTNLLEGKLFNSKDELLKAL